MRRFESRSVGSTVHRLALYAVPPSVGKKRAKASEFKT